MDGLISIVTDRKVQDAHDRQAVGASLNLGVPIPPISLGGEVPDSRILEFTVRGAFNRLEEPELEERLVLLSSGKLRGVVEGDVNTGFPQFGSTFAFGLEVDAAVPFGNNGYLTASTAIYSGPDPNPWTVRLGVTVPLEKVLGLFSQ